MVLLKCDRFIDEFSVSLSLSRGRLRESPISGLGHVSMPASGGSAAIILCCIKKMFVPFYQTSFREVKILPFIVVVVAVDFPLIIHDFILYKTKKKAKFFCGS